jgi:hypothetical protein
MTMLEPLCMQEAVEIDAGKTKGRRAIGDAKAFLSRRMIKMN